MAAASGGELSSPQLKHDHDVAAGIQLVGAGLREGSGVPQSVTTTSRSGAKVASRRAYFGDDHGWLDTPVLSRADLDAPRVGPLIVEEYDSTCVVPPGTRAERDAAGNIVITLD